MSESPIPIRRDDPPLSDDPADFYAFFTKGGSFILDTPADPTPLWGSGSEVLWAEGEALILVGGQGLGKTTLAQQLVLSRSNILDAPSTLLGFPVQRHRSGKVLYLAMDRPRQAARSFRRMVGESWRGDLDAELAVWQGPPVWDLAANPGVLLAMAQEAGAETVVVDSIKDAAIGLSDDAVGAGWNRARQKVLAAGIQLVELHHNRKAQGGGRAGPPTIDDVYGSTWITSGAGSVVLLSGAPGDPVVGLHHIKQPASEVGPLKVLHDHEHGRSSIWQQADLVAVAKTRPDGITATEAATAMFETEKPSPAEREKARRRLDRLTSEGLLRVVDEGDKSTSRATKWGA